MKTNVTLLLGSLLGLACTSLLPAAPAMRGAAAGGAQAPAGYGPGSAACTADCTGSRAACPRDQGQGAGDCTGTCVTATNDTTPVVLSPAAQAALRFQIDEERMARELYQAFGEKWGLQPFQMIPRSETRHEAVLRELAARAGVVAPSSTAGRFDDQEVQLRYDALLALGLESADSALRAGAFVEEQDIVDLDTLIAATDSPALKQVATALRTASTHHLRAFAGVLQARGGSYEPKLLKAEEFKAIVATPVGPKAGRGRGMGPGPR